MRLTRTVGPAAPPVTVEEAKAHCRVDSDHEDDLIAAWIDTAVDLLDGPTGMLGRAIVRQEWLLELASWSGAIVLPVEPVLSVGVAYLDQGGAEQDVDVDMTWLQRTPGMAPELHFASGFTQPALSASDPYPVRITMVCGFGDAADVPPAIKMAMKMMVEHWHEHRGVVAAGGSVSEIPMSAQALLGRWRRVL